RIWTMTVTRVLFTCSWTSVGVFFVIAHRLASNSSWYPSCGLSNSVPATSAGARSFGGVGGGLGQGPPGHWAFGGAGAELVTRTAVIPRTTASTPANAPSSTPRRSRLPAWPRRYAPGGGPEGAANPGGPGGGGGGP